MSVGGACSCECGWRMQLLVWAEHAAVSVGRACSCECGRGMQL